MAINGNRAVAAGYDDAEERLPGELPSHDAIFRVFNDRRATGNGRFNGNGNRKAPLVLIVDDDPAIRLLCSVYLRMEGFLVLEAGDGANALDQARLECPDLVLTDVMMPGLDGFQLAEALRDDERTRQIPLIFLSGETEPASAARAQELGALAYLTKPFDPPALSSLIAAALVREEPTATDGARPMAATHSEYLS